MRFILRSIILSSVIFALCSPFPSPAQASQQKILIGILPEMNVFKQKQRFKLLGEHLSKKTGLQVEFTILSRYGNIVERFSTEKMDGAFFGSFTGALAIKRLGVVPLVRPVNLDGTSTYHGFLFVRKDGGIRKAADMKNKRMAFVDKATTAGYLFPLAYLKENGIKDPEHFFRETLYTGSHDAAINAVLNRQADVGAAKHSIYERVRELDPRVDRELLILAESPRVPSNGLLVRSSLPEAIKSKLKSVLLGLHTDPDGKVVLMQFGALKFIETTASDYLPVFEMAKKSGINVMSYDYNNK